MLVVLVFTAILEPGLFLGDLEAACDMNMFFRMLYCALSLLIACPLLFMLANGNGNKTFWAAFCLIMFIAMTAMSHMTDADIFMLLLLASAVGAASSIWVEEKP